ncbi:MAG: hypothetical protein H0V82_13000 [Candidatus Protochlamydia sp.]|nr:hypothetical protein [Candidatus Protochlamydia sp.]
MNIAFTRTFLFSEVPLKWCKRSIKKGKNFTSSSIIHEIKLFSIAMLALLFYLPISAIYLGGCVFKRIKLANEVVDLPVQNIEIEQSVEIQPIRTISEQATSILCLDIGCTRIKSALLPKNPTLEELKNASVYIYESEKWLNSTLPQLFKEIPQASAPSTHGICMAMPGLVIDHSFFERGDLTVERSLKESIERTAGSTTFLETDDIIWMRGIVELQKLRQKKILYPCACIAIGTGVAISIAFNDENYSSFPLPDKCEELERYTGDILNYPWERHGLLGKAFFELAAAKQMSDELIREEHTNRVDFLINDLKKKFQENKIKVNSIFIAGGNSRHLIIEKLKINHSDIKIVGMTPKIMQKCQINADLIPLLGLVRIFPQLLARNNL